MSEIISALIPIVCLVVVLKLLFKPMKWIFKLLINTGLGFVCLFLLNMISSFTGIVFEINFVTAAVVGVLGVPGILLLVILKFLI